MRWITLAVLLAAARSWAGACPASPTALAAAFPAEQRTVVDHELPLEAKRLRCRTIRGHAELALVTYDANDGVVLGALVDGDRVLWSHGQALPCTPCMTDRSFSLADLDGDGKDELLVRVHKDGHDTMTGEWIEVWTIRDDDEPVSAGSVTVAATDPPDHWRCSSSVRILDRGIELVGRCSAQQDAYATGRHVYVLRDSQLVER